MEILPPNKHQNLYGHESLEENFVNSWYNKKIPHSIILSGEKGIGKSTLAYKIARFILYKSSLNNEIKQISFNEKSKYQNNLNIPENSQLFKEISLNINQNFFVIDKKNNEQDTVNNEIIVDDIRSLKLFFEKKSINNSWRIAIIDNADDLNINASNALLKLLEEPPIDCLIILVSHFPEKLLKTIKSRCIEYKLNYLNFDNFSKIIKKLNPSIKMNEIEFLGVLSNNKPGYCIEILELDGVNIYKNIINLFGKMPYVDFSEINNLYEKINNKINKNSFNLFINLINDFIHRGILKIYNINNNIKYDYFREETEIFSKFLNENNIIDIINCWSDMQDTIDKGQIFNLNNKSLMIDIFSNFSECFKKF